MTRICGLKIFLVQLILLASLTIKAQSRLKINIDADWQFRNQEDMLSSANKPSDHDFSFDGWQTVCLPHTAKIEPLVIKNPWVGISWYKKDFSLNPEWKNKKILVEFEAVMQQAEVWLNGKLLLKHTGGYLPFTIDITNEVSFTQPNRLIVKTDNHDNPEVPPGKPIASLDFCYYSGIYRDVSLIITDPLYISDPVKENRTASGGIKVWYPVVSEKEATISVATHVRNDYPVEKIFLITCKLTDKNGKAIATSISEKQTVSAGGQTSITANLNVQHPQLWHPQHPNLYTLKVEVIENGKTVDAGQSRIGIRKFEVKNDKFLVNGGPLLLVGTNRHQEYPYIGNALSDNAQYRDAMKIKQAGFNIVRLSHYPQSSAFMEACDELGLLTIDAIPGWQFVGNDTFMEHSYQDARELIRRDRNHACVAMWELSLNESSMPDRFMEEMNLIAREESPETRLITCGWIKKYYDVFIPARQHAKPPYYWKNYNGNIPLFTAEYGDWEYFAQDAGLNQAGYAGLKADERTSRQLRGDGEKRLLQQATNFLEAHNDNLRNPHLGDANWLMFDYNRDYSPDIESSGIMDILRLPKFSYFLYRSQSKLPTLKIASYWNNKSDCHNLKVFANCDEVDLYLNEKLIERKKAERNSISDKLTYPPFIFDLKDFTPGTLKAVGYINNKKVAEDKVTTADSAKLLKISFDLSGKPFKADGSDVIFVYVTICDRNGNQVYDSDREIQLSNSSGASIISPDHVKAEAGIATFLLKSNSQPADIIVSAKSPGLVSGKSFIKSSK